MVNKKQLKKGMKVIVQFYPSYDFIGNSKNGIYKGYDRKENKYIVSLDKLVKVPHNQHIGKSYNTYEPSVAYVNKDQIIIVDKKGNRYLAK